MQARVSRFNEVVGEPVAQVSLLGEWLIALAIAAVVVLVYWPGVHGFWGRDDFMQLAFARLIDSPWPLFAHDHYPPGPGIVFRPLGFASMWLGQALFGTDYEAHAIVDMWLHVGVALALFGLLRCVGMARVIALMCVLLFALHPVAIGTALWWSARFDVLATLFVLLALWCALVYRQGASPIALSATLLAAMAAMLSKEIGLAALLPASLIWAMWAWREPVSRSRALRALALIWACGFVYFLWRWSVLGTPASRLTGTFPVEEAFLKGIADWWHQVAGFLLYWVRIGSSARASLLVAGVAFLATVAAAFASGRTRLAGTRRDDLALCGLLLLVVPAVLQAPVAALNAAPLQSGVSVVESAMQSRLYYLGLAGAVIVIAVLFDALWLGAQRWARVALFCSLALAVITFGWVSHCDASRFASRSAGISGLARAAVASVAAMELPSTHCQVTFLDVDPPPEWSVYVSMDSIVKALSPDLDHVRNCWFHANYATYFNLLGAPVDAQDALPYRPLFEDGRQVPWRRVGNAVIAYVQPPHTIDPRDWRSMRFLRYSNGRFVTADRDSVATPIQSGSR